jgi:hypothetical protein
MDSRYVALENEYPQYPLDDLKKDGSAYAAVPAREIDEFHDTDESEQHSQSTKVFTTGQPHSPLPPVDIGVSTKIQVLLVIVLGIACCLACIGYTIGVWSKTTRHRRPPIVLLPDGLPGEASSFIANIILTQCLEGLAYVHSISLRWALLKENRLVYNTNIRLFTSSRISRPNSKYTNAISAALLIICYGSTSTLVIPSIDSEDPADESHNETYLNLIALLTLGLALLGQTLLAIWCYWDNLLDIPSWSSNPLNTTVTMLNQQMVKHREDRCMHPVQVPHTSEGGPELPQARQPSQWQASRSARYALTFTWILVGLAFIWWLTIVLLARSNMMGLIKTIGDMNGKPLTGPNATWHFSLDWNPIANSAVDLSSTSYYNAVFFSLDPEQQGGAETAMPIVATLIVSLLFVCAIQGLQTLGLHCAELIINLSRGEDVWRALDAQRRSGNKDPVLATPPFFAALFSWKSNMLTIFKSLLHWLLGQSLQPSISRVGFGSVFFTMIYARLFVYVVCTIIFASAIAFLTFVKPKGPQPVTYGHIQTIADLVDDWTLDEKGRFWWGDKGYKDGIRHAGMSCQKNGLGPIEMDALYAG